MKYATWKLNFSNPNYGTGPEPEIVSQGLLAEGGFAIGQPEAGGTIIGYVSEGINVNELEAWDFTYITQEDAMVYAKTIDDSAYLLEDGRIGFQFQVI